jgi:Endopolygalacturonase
MRKTIIRFAVVMMMCVGVTAFAKENPWKEMKKLDQSIKRTSFPKSDFNILSNGAVSGDSVHLATQAINTAIQKCHQSGGGRVIVPKGVFYTGGITLKSNVNLYLEEGAVLRFSTNQKDYLPVVLTRWEGIDCYNIQPLIYAYNETNIAITGKGTIDGQGRKDTWWPMVGRTEFGWKPGMIRQQDGGRPKLSKMEQSEAPINERVMTPEDALRPQMVNVYKCNQVLIEGVTLINAPFWVIHPLMCENLVVRGVTVKNHGPNGDGCDPESCNKVLIENCVFETGDDCIAIKSGRNNDGRKWNMPSQNMIIRNCEMKDGHGGVVIGSEISGGYKNLYVENCRMDSPNLDRVLRIKSNTCRGGIIENVYMRNIEVGQCKESVMTVDLLYEKNEDCFRNYPPVVRNVYLEKVTSKKSDYGVKIDGLSESVNVYNININKCSFNGVTKGNKVTGARDIVLEDLYINGVKCNNL